MEKRTEVQSNKNRLSQRIKFALAGVVMMTLVACGDQPKQDSNIKPTSASSFVDTVVTLNVDLDCPDGVEDMTEQHQVYTTPANAKDFTDINVSVSSNNLYFRETGVEGNINELVTVETATNLSSKQRDPRFPDEFIIFDQVNPAPFKPSESKHIMFLTSGYDNGTGVYIMRLSYDLWRVTFDYECIGEQKVK